MTELGKLELTAAVTVIFAILALLYRLCVETTVSQNGRIARQFRSPLRHFTRLEKKRQLTRQSYKPWQTKLLRIMYSAQECVFGIMLFVVGLLLMGTGGVHLTEGLHEFLRQKPLTLFAIGLFFTAAGIRTVLSRNRHNPFADNDD